MKTTAVRAIAPFIALICLIALATPALAHETRLEGGVQAVVGWATEPAYVGYPNAVQLRLSESGQPITDLGTDELQVEVTFGGQKTPPMALTPAFNSPGEYRAALMPTRAGEYSFRFFGTIQGEPYDQTFTSGEETFDSPRNPADVSFPAKDPTAGELAASIEQLSSEEESGGAGTTGMIALGLGALALVVALAAFFKKAGA